jgi:transcriptional regulator with XRE-family HTH domain
MAAYEAEGHHEPFIPTDTFALRLIAIRKELGLTQAEAALRCGFDDGSWSNWENGTRPRGMDVVVEKISSSLGVDRDWLMWGGGLRTGSFSSVLFGLDAVPGQTTFLDDDLNPLPIYERAELALV